MSLKWTIDAYQSLVTVVAEGNVERADFGAIAKAGKAGVEQLKS